jgi:hypothetical protein
MLSYYQQGVVDKEGAFSRLNPRMKGFKNHFHRGARLPHNLEDKEAL